MTAIGTCDFPEQANWSVYLSERPSLMRPSFEASFLPSERASLHAEFSELLAECDEVNWNGYRSDPISGEATDAARKLIANLPTDLRQPSLGAVPEGLVTFEWYKGPKNIISVIANSNNTVDYAISRGDEILHGSAPFFGTLPSTVLYHIRALGK